MVTSNPVRVTVARAPDLQALSDATRAVELLERILWRERREVNWEKVYRTAERIEGVLRRVAPGSLPPPTPYPAAPERPG